MQTFKEMIFDRFADNDPSADEVYRHGMQGGFSGFIYYDETTDMFDKYGEDIWKIFEDYDAPFPSQENRTLKQWKNAMVWSAVEILAGVYLEEQHQQMEKENQAREDRMWETWKQYAKVKE